VARRNAGFGVQLVPSERGYTAGFPTTPQLGGGFVNSSGSDTPASEYQHLRFFARNIRVVLENLLD